jgi:hypothetical protein
MKMTTHLNSKSGSSIVEFLVAAPVLALIVYFAMDINQTVEYRQGMHIAARNRAYEQHPNDLSAQQRQFRLEKDLKPFQGVDGQIDQSNSKTTMAESIRYHQSLGISLGRVGDSMVGRDGKDSGYERSSQVVGRIAQGATYAVDNISHLTNLWGMIDAEDFWVVPPPRIRTSRVEFNANTQGSLFDAALTAASVAIERPVDHEALKTDIEEKIKVRQSSLHMVRPENGYHPDQYVAQSLIGFGIGFLSKQKPWGAYSDNHKSGSLTEFNGQCLMNWDLGGSDCHSINGFYTSVVTIGAAIQVLITIAEIIPPTTAAGVAADVASELIKEAVKTAAEKIATSLKTKITERLDISRSLFGGIEPWEAFSEGAFADGKSLFENPALKLGQYQFQGNTP